MKLTLLKLDDPINDRIMRTAKKNGFKNKTDWIRWAIDRQLDKSEKAEKKIEGIAIDENGVPSLPEYKKEKEYKFYLWNGEERYGSGKDIDEAMNNAKLKATDILDFTEQ